MREDTDHCFSLRERQKLSKHGRSRVSKRLINIVILLLYKIEKKSDATPEDDMCQGLNSHYFHIIGDKLINPIVGIYTPIIRIPIVQVG